MAVAVPCCGKYREREMCERESEEEGPREKARWGQPGDGAACGWLEERAEETAGSCWCCSGEGQRVAMELGRELLLEEDDREAAASGSEEVQRELRLHVRRWDETNEVGGSWIDWMDRTGAGCTADWVALKTRGRWRRC